MADPKNSDAFEKLEQSLDRQLKCDERITFDTPSKERLGGMLKNITESGALLVTMERLTTDTDLVLYLTLSIGAEVVELGVSAQVGESERTGSRTLRGYRLSFSRTNPEVVWEALRDLAGAKKRVFAKKPETPPEKVQTPPPPPPKEAGGEEVDDFVDKIAAEKRPLPPLPQPKKNKTEDANVDDLLPSMAKSEAAKKASSGVSYTLVIVFVVALFAMGGLFLFQKWSVANVLGELPNTIPLLNVQIQDRDLTAQVSQDWLVKNTLEQKKTQLQLLADEMLSKRIESLMLVDDQGQELVLILISHGGAEKVSNVRFFNAFR